MVTIGMNYLVLEGKEEVFEGACRKVLDVVHEADCLPRVMTGSGHPAPELSDPVRRAG